MVNSINNETIREYKKNMLINTKTGSSCFSTWYKLEWLTPKTIKLLGSTKKDVDEHKYVVDAPKLGSI